MATAIKNERINIRLEPLVKQLIEQAASIDHRTLTSFIIASATQMAENILQKNQQIILDNQDYELFYNTISKPTNPNKALKKAALDYNNLSIKSDI